jgi:hypothetical protein
MDTSSQCYKVLHFRVGSCPYLLILPQTVKPCQGQMLLRRFSLSFDKFVSDKEKSFTILTSVINVVKLFLRCCKCQQIS